MNKIIFEIFFEESLFWSGLTDLIVKIKKLESVCLIYLFIYYRTVNWVGQSIVNLYTSPRYGPWTLVFTGVPILLLDQGGSRYLNSLE